MNISQTAEFRRSLENFRHLLFHYQLESGSLQQIFRFFEEDKSIGHFEELRQLDPNLMNQLLAREYVIQARRAKTPVKAKEHLETALHLDPDCPEACFELASISESAETSMMWYQRSIDASQKIIGDERIAELLKEFAQNPWQQVETHTYLKARVCLAEKLFRHGYYNVAAEHFKELLQLSPTDELNLRHYLMVSLLCENQLVEADRLHGTYRSDAAPAWYYCRAFLYFKREGATRKSKRALLRAFSRNLWVTVFLLGIEEMPRKKENKKESKNINPVVKNSFKEGSRQEAVDTVQCIAPAFIEDSQLMVWVWEVLKALPMEGE